MHHTYLDKLAYRHSPVHRLDARVKLSLAALVILAASLLATEELWRLAIFGALVLVTLLGARREHDDGYVPVCLLTAQCAREFQAAGVRKHPVDEQQVRAGVGYAEPRRVAILGLVNFESCVLQLTNKFTPAFAQAIRIQHKTDGPICGHCFFYQSYALGQESARFAPFLESSL